MLLFILHGEAEKYGYNPKLSSKGLTQMLEIHPRVYSIIGDNWIVVTGKGFRHKISCLIATAKSPYIQSWHLGLREALFSGSGYVFLANKGQIPLRKYLHALGEPQKDGKSFVEQGRIFIEELICLNRNVVVAGGGHIVGLCIGMSLEKVQKIKPGSIYEIKLEEKFVMVEI